MPIISTFPSGSGGGSLKAQSIVVTEASKTDYFVGETFDKSTIKVTAYYDYGIEQVLGDADYTISPSGELKESDTAITIAYQKVSTTLAITVTKESLTVPTQSDSLTYNGNNQVPTWDGYNSAKMTKTETAQSAVGTYSTTFALTDTTKYQWADGTFDDKTIQWTIAKATGTLTLTPESVTLDADNTTADFTIGGTFDGTYTVESQDTTVATVALKSGSTYTVSSVNEKTGTTAIVVTPSGGTNYTVPNASSVAVTASFLPAVGTALEDCTWEEISKIAAAGSASTYWNVGDKKSIAISGTVGTLSVSGAYYVYILGFDHNGSNTITFGTFKNASGTDLCLIDGNYNSTATNGTKYLNMNHWGNYNYGGWASCDMRYDILGSTNKAPTGYGSAKTTSLTVSSATDAPSDTPTNPVTGTLMAALPEDLRAVMKPMTVYSDNTGAATNTAACIGTTVDYLPLLAEYEIFGSRTYANQYEYTNQKQYSYYSSGNSRVKYRHSSSGSTAGWWGRSPSCNYTSDFCGVSTGGSAYSTYAYYSLGVAPAFTI